MPPTEPRRAAGLARAPRTLGPLLLTLLLGGGGLLLGSGCGDPPEPAPAPQAPVARTLPKLEEIPLADRAAFGLRCLMRGPPRNSGLLPVPQLHRVNLDLATRDLRSLARETIEHLRDAGLRGRAVQGALRSSDPWINVLRLMQEIGDVPADVVLAWTRPVLDLPHRADLAPLRVETVRTLSLIAHPDAAGILFELLSRDVHDRELAVFALPALLKHGAPWRRRAVDMVLRRAGPTVWEQVSDRLTGLVPQGSVDASVATLLAWWSWLAESSGPRFASALPRVKTPAWSRARLWLDPAVPRAVDRDGRTVPAYGALPSSVAHVGGWLPTDLTDQGEFPVMGYGLTGKLPAAETRCVLGRWGYEPFARSVREDLANEKTEPRDAGLFYAAYHCMLDTDDAELRELAKRKLTKLLAEDAEPTLARAQEIQRLLAALPPCRDPEAWGLLVRILRTLRPIEPFYRTALLVAYEAMAPRESERVEIVTELFEGTDKEDMGVGLYLMRNARSAAYLPAIEKRFDSTDDPTLKAVLRRLMLFVYAGGGATPGQVASFVRRFEGWLAEADDRMVIGTAGVLADLGPAGLEAYRAGLRGPRRVAYIRAWPLGRKLVPQDIAEEMVAPVDRTTGKDELGLLLHLAYTSFPAGAAPAIERLRKDLPAEAEPMLAPLIERLRNRAPVVVGPGR